MIEEKPDIKLIDEDKTITISVYTYNHLMYESFKYQNAKQLYDVTKEKLDKMYNFVIKGADLYASERDKRKLKDIYYGIDEEEEDE